MYKITTPSGSVLYCNSYNYSNNTMVLDGNNIVSGAEDQFTIVDLSSALSTDWYIDVGPFFDRFGNAKMAVLTSTNATVKAIVQDVMVRKWVDLKRADVASGIDALIALGVTGVNGALKTSILTTPVTVEEQLALLRLYFPELT